MTGIVSISSARFVEATGTDPIYVFTISLSEAQTADVRLDVLFQGDTAGFYNNFNDAYLSGSGLLNVGGYGGELVIAAGATSATFTVRIDADAIDELDENFNVLLSNLSGPDVAFAGGDTRLSTTAIILDDDTAALNRTYFVSDAEVVEGDAGTRTLVFEVELSSAATAQVRLDYQTLGISAAAGVDFTSQAGTLIFNAGELRKTVSITVSGDAAFEATETLALLVTPQAGSAAQFAGGASVSADAEGIGTIRDDDGSLGTGPVVSIAGARVIEGTDTSDYSYLVYDVTLSEAATSEVRMDVLLQGDTAGFYNNFNDAYLSASGLIGVDAYGGELVIAAGDTTGRFFVRIDGDAIDEIDENVTVQLSNLTGSGVSFAGGVDRLFANGVILDDDTGGLNRAYFVSDAEVVEGDSGSRELVFTIELSQASTAAINFNYELRGISATAGSDFTGGSGTLAFAAGQTRAVVRVAVSGDTALEATETLALVVTPQAASAGQFASGGTIIPDSEGIGTIRDDDAGSGPVVSIASARVIEGSDTSDYSYLVYDVSLSEAATSEVRMDVLLQGDTAGFFNNFNDAYLSASGLIGVDAYGGELVIAAGATTGRFFVRVDGDNLDEIDENLTVQLSNLTGSGVSFAGGVDRLFANGVILDDDTGGLNRTYFVSDAEVVEGDAGSRELVFTIELSQASTTAINLDYELRGISAIAGSDFTGGSGTLNFAAGQTQAVVRVTVSGDSTVESTETLALIVTPQAASAGQFASGGAIVPDSEGIGTIRDDDAGSGPVVSIASARVIEGTDTSDNNYLAFDVSLSEAATGDIRMNVLLQGDTASFYNNFNDAYLSASGLINVGAYGGELVIAAGATTGRFFVRVDGDNLDEIDENVTVQLSNLTGAAVTGSGVSFAGGVDRLYANGIILDDDTGGFNRTYFVSDAEVVEGDSGSRELIFTVELSQASTSAINLNYVLNGITATAGSDFTGGSGTLNFAAGQTRAAVRVAVSGDNTLEATETLALVVTPQAASAGQFASGGAIVPDSEGIGTIRDDDGGTGPVVSIANTRVIEGTDSSDNNYLAFDVSLSEAATANVTLTATLRAGTAVVGTPDFYLSNSGLTGTTATSGILTFAAGQTTATVFVRVDGDAVDELDETMFLDLSGLSANAKFAGNVATLSAQGIILDDDTTSLNRVLLVSDTRTAEGNAAAFVVRLSQGDAVARTFTWTTANGTATNSADYSGGTGTVTFAAGQTEAVVLIPTLTDAITDNNETFTLSFAPGQVGIANAAAVAATATITNVAAVGAQLAISGAPSLAEGNAGTTAFSFTVTRTGSTAGASSANYAVTGSGGNPANAADFAGGVLPTGTVSFAAGETVKTIIINVAGDTLVEASESFAVTLSAPTGATLGTALATGTIQNDDTAATALAISGSPSLLEGNSGTTAFTFTVTRSGSTAAASSASFAVTGSGGSPANAADFAGGVLPTGTVSFAVGETSKTITINVAGDLAAETHEGFTVTLTNPVGATLGTSTASGTIRDDDTPAPPGFYTGTTLADVFVANAAVPWIINGRAGADQLTGNSASDIIFGGTGDDTLAGAGGDDIFIDGKGDGKDQIDGGAGYDRVLASIDSADIGLAGITGIEEISSGGFTGVFISGKTTADTLDFSSVRLTGITSINAGSGNDTITGSAAADTINGGAGADVLAGSGGDDVFDYNATGDSGFGVTKADRILDFTSGSDIIDLSGIDASTGTTGNQAFDFIGTAAFTALGQLRIGVDSNGNVAVFGNTAGSLAADFQISLVNNVTPLEIDFVL